MTSITHWEHFLLGDNGFNAGVDAGIIKHGWRARLRGMQAKLEQAGFTSGEVILRAPFGRDGGLLRSDQIDRLRERFQDWLVHDLVRYAGELKQYQFTAYLGSTPLPDLLDLVDALPNMKIALDWAMSPDNPHREHIYHQLIFGGALRHLKDRQIIVEALPFNDGVGRMFADHPNVHYIADRAFFYSPNHIQDVAGNVTWIFQSLWDQQARVLLDEEAHLGGPSNLTEAQRVHARTIEEMRKCERIAISVPAYNLSDIL